MENSYDDLMKQKSGLVQVHLIMTHGISLEHAYKSSACINGILF